MTVQEFIKSARKLKDKTVLEHALIFHEAVCVGVVHRGKNNEQMRKLRRLGFFTLDKESTLLPNYNPAWHLTPAGRAALSSTERGGARD